MRWLLFCNNVICPVFYSMRCIAYLQSVVFFEDWNVWIWVPLLSFVLPVVYTANELVPIWESLHVPNVLLNRCLLLWLGLGIVRQSHSLSEGHSCRFQSYILTDLLFWGCRCLKYYESSVEFVKRFQSVSLCRKANLMISVLKCHWLQVLASTYLIASVEVVPSVLLLQCLVAADYNGLSQNYYLECNLHLEILNTLLCLLQRPYLI